MENNVTNPENNSVNTSNSEVLVWEKPVLYKEEWLNTLTGTTSGNENTGRPDRSH